MLSASAVVAFLIAGLTIVLLPGPAQFLVLGLILAVLSVAWDCVLSLAAHAVSLRLSASQRVARWLARITGALFVGLGLRLALTER